VRLHDGAAMTRIGYKDGHRALAVEMVCHAVKDMRDMGVQSKEQLRPLQGFGKERLRLGATVWLASKSAMWWFDHIGVDQLYGLWKMGWEAHAKEFLANEDIDLSPEEHSVLELGLDALKPTSFS
jgi:hypothetical protein